MHGPGGIGKTTLLLEMRARASAAGRTTLLLDGSEIDPSPDGFSQAVEAAGAAHAAQGARADGGQSGTVLLVDGYEQLGAIDGWLRQDFVPSLPAEDVVVLAGREPPAAAWRTDPGWRQVVAVHPLGHLDDADSADLLAGPASRHRTGNGCWSWAGATRWHSRCSPTRLRAVPYRTASPTYPT